MELALHVPKDIVEILCTYALISRHRMLKRVLLQSGGRLRRLLLVKLDKPLRFLLRMGRPPFTSKASSSRCGSAYMWVDWLLIRSASDYAYAWCDLKAHQNPLLYLNKIDSMPTR